MYFQNWSLAIAISTIYIKTYKKSNNVYLWNKYIYAMSIMITSVFYLRFLI